MFLPLKISAQEIKSLSNVMHLSVPQLKSVKESNEVLSKLKNILDPNDGVIKANKLQSSWLPSIGHYDIFISYSHNDEDMALKLYAWLKNIGLKCFIDSVYWKSADDLLKIIDDKYSLYDDVTPNKYEYKKRNYSTSLVHALLSMTIMETIQKSDMGIFIESNNSTILKLDDIKERTLSPWIYQEVNMMVNIQKQEPEWLTEDRRGYSEGGVLNMSFSIQTEELISIDSMLLNGIRGSGQAWLMNLYQKLRERHHRRQNNGRQLLCD